MKTITAAPLETGLSSQDSEQDESIVIGDKTTAAIVSEMSRKLGLAYPIRSIEFDYNSNLYTGLPTQTRSDDRDLIQPLKPPKRNLVPSRIPINFSPLQEWEGCVMEIINGHFTARLVDITAKSSVAEEEAEFSLEDLSPNDVRTLKVGAVFRWVIGYERTKGGTKRKVSQIIFRQLPQWTKSEIEASNALASHYSESISWD